MRFVPPLIQATLLRRYKRFLADVRLSDGTEITVHCPNTGSMKNCVVEDSPCYLWDSNNPKRKYRYSWELATTYGGGLAGINAARANHLVSEALEAGRIAELDNYDTLQREQKYGLENSRIDLLLSRAGEQCFVEVKSVTLDIGGGQGLFPDAVSDRASKHVRELMEQKKQGHRAVLLFCVQHSRIERVSPADEIDPRYGELLRQAAAIGVEVLAYSAEITPEELTLKRSLPVLLGQ